MNLMKLKHNTRKENLRVHRNSSREGRKQDMSETEYTENGELYPIMIEGLTEKEAAEYKQILGRFLESYKKSDGEQQEFQWLCPKSRKIK